MELRIRNLGLLTVAVGILGALICGVLYWGVGDLRFAGDLMPSGDVIAYGWAAAMLVLALPYVVAGVSLMQHRRWARLLSMVVMTCGLLCFPHGTALGIYGILVLTSPEADEVFSPRFRR